jgi:hypothetical protein
MAVSACAAGAAGAVSAIVSHGAGAVELGQLDLRGRIAAEAPHYMGLEWVRPMPSVWKAVRQPATPFRWAL